MQFEPSNIETAPVWIPDELTVKNANLSLLMQELHIKDVGAFHQWSVEHYQDFWKLITQKLNIIFKKKFKNIVDLSKGIESPTWFPGSTLNIADSCFTHSPDKIAVICQRSGETLTYHTYEALNHFSNQIANSLVKLGFKQNDAIAIIMPMDYRAIAIYLGIIKMGGVVVSIADSFSSNEIQLRLKISNSKAVFTQDNIYWDKKTLPLYSKIKTATDLPIISDNNWDEFLVNNIIFNSVPCEPMSACNILFSSGTTATPKAIPWNHTTPIKVASDAYLHQNIKPDDVLAWPTNLGWMMGPWLLFAALMNHATIALFTDTPKNREFGEFVQNAKITMLGVVPTLVGAWRHTQCMENLDWSAIKVFSSSGECSNPSDMGYLMSLANKKPIIEYCGGTEIGGAYISSTVLQNNYPSLFSTPTMGLDFTLLEDNEVAILPPSIGLSTELLNADHHKIYYADMPTTKEGKTLRRHGDQIKKLSNHYYCMLGRVDDSMNLGGIKVSSAEIERALSTLKDIDETAAVAITQNGQGISQLIIFVVTHKKFDKNNLIKLMQQEINERLNPLFKIHDIVFMDELPKTASNKIMRRVLRDGYK